jgi:hypothetical protein
MRTSLYRKKVEISDLRSRSGNGDIKPKSSQITSKHVQRRRLTEWPLSANSPSILSSTSSLSRRLRQRCFFRPQGPQSPLPTRTQCTLRVRRRPHRHAPAETPALRILIPLPGIPGKPGPIPGAISRKSSGDSVRMVSRSTSPVPPPTYLIASLQRQA